MEVCAKIIVKGFVQGVGFRWFVYKIATDLNLKGYVKNLYNGDVEIEVEGERGQIEELIKQVKVGPPLSRVTDVRIEWKKCNYKYTTFKIEH
ncbi:MAG: acylphosphatase [Calditrichaeota bacterium]|nr:MAG: acylphosphatase [Calditrichota bacterium]